jgi:hypothetical protein
MDQVWANGLTLPSTERSKIRVTGPNPVVSTATVAAIPPRVVRPLPGPAHPAPKVSPKAAAGDRHRPRVAAPGSHDQGLPDRFLRVVTASGEKAAT